MPLTPIPIDAVLDVLPDAVVVIDEAGDVVLANHRAEELLGRPHGDLVGTRLEALLDGQPPLDVTSAELEGLRVLTLRPPTTERRDLLRQQAVIAQLGQQALAGSSTPELCEEAARTLAETLDVELVEVLELLPGGRQFAMRGRFGWNHLPLVPVADTQVGLSLARREPVLVRDTASERRFRAKELHDEHGVESGLAVPMLVGERELGAIGVHAQRPREFSADDVNFVQAVANIVAAAMDRRRAEQALEQASSRLHAVVDASPAVIYLKDLDGTVILANRQFETLFGLEPGGARGKPNDTFVDAKTAAAIDDNDRAVIASGAPMEFEERLPLPDGERIFISLKFPLRDAAGAITGVGGVSTDVTDRTHAAEERAALEARLARAERLESVGQLAGGIAHDFNNLLAVIANYAGFLQQSVGPGSRAAEDVEQILLACRGATELTRRLLLFSRRRAGNPQLIDLRGVIADTERLLRRSLGEQVELRTRVEDALWPVLADPAQLEQVLMNLAINARDAMPEGGALTIEADNVELAEGEVPGLAGRAVRLVVGDTGRGMTPEILDRAFEPFFSTKPAGEGTGLGLATVYGIVRGAGGHAELRSDAVSGTAVIVHLPGSRGEPAPNADDRPSAAPPARGESVLLVEDKEAVRVLTSRILEDAGYRVMAAPDGVEALSAHGAGGVPGVDALITDVVMPGLSGRELADELRRHRPGLPVVFVSGYTEDHVVEEARRDGATAFVEKPFSADELLTAVRTVLDAR